MAAYLGIDTSNYTTSAAIFDSDSKAMLMEKKLLPTKEGALGLRQSEAVFSHVKQLGDLISALFSSFSEKIEGIGVSSFPRRKKGSYMPCFLVGQMAAQSLSAALQVPLYTFSHQEGHIAAALYSANRLSFLQKPFLAFHLSGGTTDAMLVEPGEPIFSIRQVAGSLDLKAGQVVDRVGLLLGCRFPCGKELTELALHCTETKIKVKPVMKGENCCLSGIENQCQRLVADGKPKEYVALYALTSIQAALSKMTKALLDKYGDLPLLYAGGVMSNVIIRKYMEETFGGVFADASFSADNAGGIAWLAGYAHSREKQ